MRGARLGAALVVTGLAVTVGASTAAGVDSAAGQPTSLAAEFVDRAAELGDDAPVAGTFALDKGYDVTQIVDGVTDRSLQKDGSVTKDGAPVTPARPASNVADEEDEVRAIEDSIPAIARKIPDDAERGALVLTGILALASDGYTPEQIINDGLLDGGMRFTNNWGVGIFEVTKGKAGKLVKPANAPDQKSKPASADATDVFLDKVIDEAVNAAPFDRVDAKHKTSLRFNVTGKGLSVSVPIGAAAAFKTVMLGSGTGTLTIDGFCSTDGREYPVVQPLAVAAVGDPQPNGRYAFELGIVPTGDPGYPTGGSGKDECKVVDRAQAAAAVAALDAQLPKFLIALKAGSTATGAAALNDGELPLKAALFAL